MTKDHAGGVPPTQIREAIAEILRPDRTDAFVKRTTDQILALLTAEYKQLLNKLPEKWQINIETSAGIYTPPEVAGHPIEYYQGKNAMLDQCRAIIEARIKELDHTDT